MAVDPTSIIREGWAQKNSAGKKGSSMGNLLAGWDNRYFVVAPQRILWFKNEEAKDRSLQRSRRKAIDAASLGAGDRRDTITRTTAMGAATKAARADKDETKGDLRLALGTTIEYDGSGVYSADTDMQVNAESRKLILRLGSSEEAKDWVKAIELSIMTAAEDEDVAGEEETICIIKPGALSLGNSDAIKALVEVDSLRIKKATTVLWSEDEAKAFYSNHAGESYFDALISEMSSSELEFMIVVGEGATLKLRNIIGPTDPEVARSQAPKSIRGKYGVNTASNAIHGSDSPASAYREIAALFPMYKTHIYGEEYGGAANVPTSKQLEEGEKQLEAEVAAAAAEPSAEE